MKRIALLLLHTAGAGTGAFIAYLVLDALTHPITAAVGALGVFGYGVWRFIIASDFGQNLFHQSTELVESEDTSFVDQVTHEQAFGTSDWWGLFKRPPHHSLDWDDQ